MERQQLSHLTNGGIWNTPGAGGRETSPVRPEFRADGIDADVSVRPCRSIPRVHLDSDAGALAAHAGPAAMPQPSSPHWLPSQVGMQLLVRTPPIPSGTGGPTRPTVRRVRRQVDARLLLADRAASQASCTALAVFGPDSPAKLLARIGPRRPHHDGEALWASSRCLRRRSRLRGRLEGPGGSASPVPCRQVESVQGGGT